MKRLVITNTCYGYIYTKLFLDQCLKSFLDQTNIPKFKNDTEFVIFTDAESKGLIAEHENYFRLLEVLSGNVRFEQLVWPEKINEDKKYVARYSRISETLRRSVKIALDRDAWLIPLCADQIVSQNFIPKLVAIMQNGYDAVFARPIIAAAEPMIQRLGSYFRAYPSTQLGILAHECLNPLWTHSFWEATQFTRSPFVMIWGSPTGLLARSFSVTPVIVNPSKEMLEVNGVIDLALPAFCHNPYLATDWDEAPIVNIDPLSAHYPPFMNHMSSVEYVKTWAEVHIRKDLYNNLEVEWYYPNKKKASIHPDLVAQSNEIIKAIST